MDNISGPAQVTTELMSEPAERAPDPSAAPGSGPHLEPTVAPETVPDSWTRVRLIEPSDAGFVHVGASSGRWRFPLPLPRARRRAVRALMRAAARRLLEDPRVNRADVFNALLRPPGRRRDDAGRDAPEPDFDVVMLVECATVADAQALAGEDALTALAADLHADKARTLIFAGSNPRRIGPVDHERQGVFLFNYFWAGSIQATLNAWQYTAGWFQDQTGLDNSTVLQPVEPERVPYRLVNHCRWDHLRDVVPDLVFNRSFRSFVLRVFNDNGVAPRPNLYRLDRSGHRRRQR